MTLFLSLRFPQRRIASLFLTHYPFSPPPSDQRCPSFPRTKPNEIVQGDRLEIDTIGCTHFSCVFNKDSHRIHYSITSGVGDVLFPSSSSSSSLSPTSMRVVLDNRRNRLRSYRFVRQNTMSTANTTATNEPPMARDTIR